MRKSPNYFARTPHPENEFSLFEREPEDGDILYQGGEFFKRESAVWIKIK